VLHNAIHHLRLAEHRHDLHLHRCPDRQTTR
jgi:hypothetical protein